MNGRKFVTHLIDRLIHILEKNFFPWLFFGIWYFLDHYWYFLYF